MAHDESDPIGLHRVLEPPGCCPRRRSGSTPDRELWPDEVRVRVERLNLDAASFRQLERKHAGDGDAVRAEVLEIVAQPRQDAQPGDRLRRHARRHRRGGRAGAPRSASPSATGSPPWSRSPSPRWSSRTGWPGWDGRSEQVPARRLRDPVRPHHRRRAPRRPAGRAGLVGDGRLRRAGADRARVVARATTRPDRSPWSAAPASPGRCAWPRPGGPAPAHHRRRAPPRPRPTCCERRRPRRRGRGLPTPATRSRCATPSRAPADRPT